MLTKNAYLAVALVFTLIFAGMCVSLASNMETKWGYAADEEYYVTAARNIMRDAFGVQPTYFDSGEYHYTLFFQSISIRDNAVDNLVAFLENENWYVVPPSYENLPAITVASKARIDYDIIIRNFPEVVIIQSGYGYPDENAFTLADYVPTPFMRDYLNPEHPPLVKYIIGFSMLVLGDKPINWRIPSIIVGALMLLLVYLIVTRLTNNGFVGLFIFLFAFSDPVVKVLSSIGTLDIFVAFFMTLSVWLALRKNYILAAIAVGLATSCKYPGIFSAGALLIFMLSDYMADARSHGLNWRGAFKRVMQENLYKLVLYPIIIPALVLFMVNIPMIVGFGFDKWFAMFKFSIGASTTTIPAMTAGAYASVPTAPWEWFFSQNMFSGFTGFMSLIFVMALVALPIVIYLGKKVNRDYLAPPLWFGASFIGFVLVWLVRRNIYSYYVVVLTPMAYVLAGLLIWQLLELIALRHDKKSSVVPNQV